jgi:hypothetical protein
MREFCESAKKGRVCPDDLCRGADITLCGFDIYEYERVTADDIDESETCFHAVSYSEACEDCENECGCGSGKPIEFCCGYA